MVVFGQPMVEPDSGQVVAAYQHGDAPIRPLTQQVARTTSGNGQSQQTRRVNNRHEQALHADAVGNNRGDQNRPDGENTGYGDDQSSQLFGWTESHTWIKPQLEIQKNEAGRDGQQVARDVDAVLQVQLDKRESPGCNGGG